MEIPPCYRIPFFIIPFFAVFVYLCFSEHVVFGETEIIAISFLNAENFAQFPIVLPGISSDFRDF